MNFEISADDVRLMHLNVRSEKHGAEEVTAIDLKLRWQTGNEALLQFHPELRKALYAASTDARQLQVGGLEPAMPNLMFPDLAPRSRTSGSRSVTGSPEGPISC